MGTGRFRVLIRWPCDLGHHSCWAPWGGCRMRPWALLPAPQPTRPGPIGPQTPWGSCHHPQPKVLERPKSLVGGGCLGLAHGSLAYARGPLLLSPLALVALTAETPTPRRKKSWKEARCPPHLPASRAGMSLYQQIFLLLITSHVTMIQPGMWFRNPTEWK